MRGFKSYDLFQKVTLDGLNQPTLIGSIFSISAITIMLYLFIREVINFYTPHIIKDTIVVQDKYPNELMHLEMNIDFNNLPCNLVSVDQEDSIGNHHFDLSDTIIKTKVTNTNKKSRFHNLGQNTEALFKAIESGDKCTLKGYLEISKVPGSFHISFHNYRPIYGRLKKEKPNLYNKINLNHQINYLYFGNLNVKKIKKFGIKPESFTHKNTLPNFLLNKKSKDYLYYIKVIPYELVDENWGTVDHYYQYSLSIKESDFDGDNDEMPILYMKYEFSPVTMRITLSKRDYLHFITHISAIIGGIFVVFSIFNKFIVGLFDAEKS